MIPYEILSTGSCGNATILNGNILIDCGLPFKNLTQYVQDLSLVLLTHIHSDHFNRGAIKKIAQKRPGIRWGCGKWLLQPLLDCGVSRRVIDVYEMGRAYDYGQVKVEPFFLIHNVDNCGYKVIFKDCKVVYATDTSSLTGIVAKNYDLYLIEANYTDEDIERRIREKQKRGEYAYEVEARRHHLSQSRCDDWLYQNMGSQSRYVYMHQHRNNDDELMEDKTEDGSEDQTRGLEEGSCVQAERTDGED